MNNIDNIELRKIQLEILDSIDSFCRENGINYYLFAGTLLGEVRHKGYIPWDDDIDVCMKREDYNVFFDSFNSQGTYYKAINHSIDKKYYLASGKVIDTRTEMIEAVSTNMKIGVYVDVFPMDYIPDDDIQFNKLNREIDKYRKMLALKNMRWNKERSVVKNLIVSVSHILLFPISINHIIDKISDLASLYENDKNNCSHIGDISVFTYGKKELFDIQCFDEVTELEFENKKYLVPKEYDKILSKMYGEYMALPPEEKRISHHSFSAHWKE